MKSFYVKILESFLLLLLFRLYNYKRFLKELNNYVPFEKNFLFLLKNRWNHKIAKKSLPKHEYISYMQIFNVEYIDLHHDERAILVLFAFRNL
jgi:hypothetical protein